MSLTSEDREDLRGLGQGQVPAVVEQIVARHVAAALNAAADEIEATCPPERTDAAHGRLDAARIVRARTT